ncbi:MAG: hypothetical protein M3Y23_05290, partial [Actinomycetota bacterium]|nr:hypothetical protein [Actinomycetota bacterium]
MSRPNILQAVALDFAVRQHGVVSRQQLLERHVPARSIAKAIEGRRLFPVYGGVYSVGRPMVSRDGALVASLLAAGEGAVLGGRSAAALWGFLDHRNPIDVMRTKGGTDRRGLMRVEGENWWPYLTVHQSKHLPSSGLTDKRGLAVTSPEHTLWDLAALLPNRRFRWAFFEADRLELLDDLILARYAERTQGRKGGGLFK